MLGGRDEWGLAHDAARNASTGSAELVRAEDPTHSPPDASALIQEPNR
jgi:hypothetical protein